MMIFFFIKELRVEWLELKKKENKYKHIIYLLFLLENMLLDLEKI